jgi:hypothetical protein
MLISANITIQILVSHDWFSFGLLPQHARDDQFFVFVLVKSLESETHSYRFQRVCGRIGLEPLSSSGIVNI